MTSEYIQLLNNLETLKLTEIKNRIDEVTGLVSSNNISFTEGLLKLTNMEIDHRKDNIIKSMVKVGAFPFIKEVKDFDFDFQPSINKQEILELENLGFMDKAENIVFLGPSGVGKTHLATAIGIAAAKRRNITYFIKCHDLITQLKKAKIENRLEEIIKHFNKYRLLILDELGYLPIYKEDSKLLFQLIDKRYEKKSVIITTNINFGEWDEVFGDPVIANAILDRILHHAKVVSINGKSYRLKDHITKENKNNE